MQLAAKFFLVILICSFITAPSLVGAAVPITQEEIEAILERDQVEQVSSTTLPDDLKKRLGQTVASTTDAIKPAVSETINKAEQAVATATNIISSTSGKIKNNLDNIQAQAKTDLKNTFFGRISEIFSSAWKALAGWFKGIFWGKPLTGSTN